MATFSQIEEARQNVEDAETMYLRRWGWTLTCNTPGSHWLWQRDFKNEDAETYARWLARAPGPMGKSSQPRPYGLITASRELAVSMTVRCLDEQPELAETDEMEGAET